jgi:hypothetical protein
MLGAYRRLASRVRENMVAPVVEGLEGAVEFGTAQAARLEKVRVAGKTGSVRTSGNGHGAWFAGLLRAGCRKWWLLFLWRADRAALMQRRLQDGFCGIILRVELEAALIGLCALRVRCLRGGGLQGSPH